MSGGRLSVDGASAGTTATYGAGRALEFDATFTAAPFQTLGFATDLNAPPWATFSTKGDSAFYARTHNGSVSTETPLPSSLLGSSHRYRIEWAANEVRFFVDGAPVATHSVSFADNMRPLSSDFNPGGTDLSVDWLRMSPYAASGSFESRILDAGENADWGLWHGTPTHRRAPASRSASGPATARPPTAPGPPSPRSPRAATTSPAAPVTCSTGLS